MVSNDRHIEDEEGAPLSKPTTDALAALHVNPLAQDDQPGNLPYHAPFVSPLVMATYPFDFTAGTCLMGSYFAHRVLKNTRAAAGAAGFALLYWSAGRMVGRGYVRPGYDLGWATSAGLLTWLGPSAVLSTGGPARAWELAMCTVGALSGISHAYNAYSIRAMPPVATVMGHAPARHESKGP